MSAQTIYIESHVMCEMGVNVSWMKDSMTSDVINVSHNIPKFGLYLINLLTLYYAREIYLKNTELFLDS